MEPTGMKWSEYVKMKDDPDIYLKHMCYDKVNSFFKNQSKTRVWMETENPGLGGVTPIDMIAMGRYQKLMDFIENCLEGNRP